MKSILCAMVAALSLSGCLADDEPEPQELETESAMEPVAPFHVDETFDLVTEIMDKTWSWTMSDNMTGRVSVELFAKPTMLRGAGGICYEITWPEGRQAGGNLNCGTVFANVGLTVSPGPLLADEAVYSANLFPNKFTLHVWNPNGPELADLRVVIDTWAADE